MAVFKLNTQYLDSSIQSADKLHQTVHPGMPDMPKMPAKPTGQILDILNENSKIIEGIKNSDNGISKNVAKFGYIDDTLKFDFTEFQKYFEDIKIEEADPEKIKNSDAAVVTNNQIAWLVGGSTIYLADISNDETKHTVQTVIPAIREMMNQSSNVQDKFDYGSKSDNGSEINYEEYNKAIHDTVYVIIPGLLENLYIDASNSSIIESFNIIKTVLINSKVGSTLDIEKTIDTLSHNIVDFLQSLSKFFKNEKSEKSDEENSFKETPFDVKYVSKDFYTKFAEDLKKYLTKLNENNSFDVDLIKKQNHKQEDFEEQNIDIENIKQESFTKIELENEIKQNNFEQPSQIGKDNNKDVSLRARAIEQIEKSGSDFLASNFDVNFIVSSKTKTDDFFRKITSELGLDLDLESFGFLSRIEKITIPQLKANSFSLRTANDLINKVSSSITGNNKSTISIRADEKCYIYDIMNFVMNNNELNSKGDRNFKKYSAFSTIRMADNLRHRVTIDIVVRDSFIENSLLKKFYSGSNIQDELSPEDRCLWVFNDVNFLGFSKGPSFSHNMSEAQSFDLNFIFKRLIRIDPKKSYNKDNKNNFFDKFEKFNKRDFYSETSEPVTPTIETKNENAIDKILDKNIIPALPIKIDAQLAQNKNVAGTNTDLGSGHSLEGLISTKNGIADYSGQEGVGMSVINNKYTLYAKTNEDKKSVTYYLYNLEEKSLLYKYHEYSDHTIDLRSTNISIDQFRSAEEAARYGALHS